MPRRYWQEGEPYVWLSALGLSFVMSMLVLVIIVILVKGMSFFWPQQLAELHLTSGEVILGEVLNAEVQDDRERFRIKVANRDIYGQGFRWLWTDEIDHIEYPDNAIHIERASYGTFFGYVPESTTWEEFERTLARADELREQKSDIDDDIIDLNLTRESLQNKAKKMAYAGKGESKAYLKVMNKYDQLAPEFETLRQASEAIQSELQAMKMLVMLPNHTERILTFDNVLALHQPNQMSTFDKIGLYAHKVVELLTEPPREANTEGGIFPAIFGTVMMVLLMSLFAIPFGVIAAIYLREYAQDGPFVRLVRICVNNLAGVPSIVYGVFGLGFFVYTVGAGIDQIFFPHRLPTPTLGTGGILWASLTLALLTVPVVIVSTEEALAAIPQEIRQASLGLGATKFQTLIRVIIPMATPGILTGFILATARAAGEVAPLMLTGAVKLAADMPLDGQFPFLHLDRKFMHLGFHIYDLAFQSPNVEAVLPMVYVVTALLLFIVISLSSFAIILRNRMREKYLGGVF